MGVGLKEGRSVCPVLCVLKERSRRGDIETSSHGFQLFKKRGGDRGGEEEQTDRPPAQIHGQREGLEERNEDTPTGGRGVREKHLLKADAYHPRRGLL